MGLRRFVLPALLFALAGLIGVGAIADHRNKSGRMNRAELLEWYCAHDGTRCGGPSSAAIERHWNERQIGYEAAVVILGSTAILLAAIRARRR